MHALKLHKTEQNDRYIHEFMTYFKGDRAARPKSVTVYQKELNKFRNHFPSQDLLTLKETDLRQWKQTLVIKGLAARTINQRLSVTRSFYKYFVDTEGYEEILVRNPMRNVKNVRIPKKEKVVFSQQQAEGLMTGVMQTAVFALRDYCIWLTFLTCALRVSELINLNVDDVDFDRDIILIRDAKGGKDRLVGMPRRLRDALHTYLVRETTKRDDNKHRIDRKRAGWKFFAKGSSQEIHGNALFLTQNGERFTDNGVSYLFKEYAKKLGMYKQGASLHALRRTAATLMHKEGVDVFVIQEVLGHSNLSTTREYIQLDKSRVIAASEKNPLSKGVDILMLEKMREAGFKGKRGRVKTA